MEQFGQNNTEKKEGGIKEEFSYTESSQYGSLNTMIDVLLENKFSGVEVHYKSKDHNDPNYQALHDAHLDNYLDDETEVKRTLQFTDENQQKEFHRLVDILKNGTTEEKDTLLREIGYLKDTE
jgi:hypothetical protein